MQIHISLWFLIITLCFLRFQESNVLVPMEIGLRFSAAALVVLVSITAWPGYVQCGFDPLQQMQDATIADVIRQHGRDVFVAKGKYGAASLNGFQKKAACVLIFYESIYRICHYSCIYTSCSILVGLHRLKTDCRNINHLQHCHFTGIRRNEKKCYSIVVFGNFKIPLS